MSVREIEIKVPPEKFEDEAWLKSKIAQYIGVKVAKVKEVRVIKTSIDARKHPVCYRFRCEYSYKEGALAQKTEKIPSLALVRSSAPQAIIVGCGPGGLFAALRCLELGVKPIILERGKTASERRFDLAPILREGRVLEESNYCFGEGGAGTFSDGKLYTRAKKRGSVRAVYETLVAYGAPEEILIEAHPHIGSNLLPKVVMAIREDIRKRGGEVLFGKKVVDFLIEGSTLKGVRTADEHEYYAQAIILATGHSARDIYHLLDQKQVAMEAKAFAVGVRIEHPQPLIDQIQYHLRPGESREKNLPAARYQLATTIQERGVHSFCMCPGGFIVPCATQNDEVVVNGMSLSRRDSPFANSGLVSGVDPKDLLSKEFLIGGNEQGVLAGLAFQKRLERLAKEAGGGGQVAPAQRVVDFLKEKKSSQLPKTSYFPGVNAARIDQLLPSPLVWRLQKGLKTFGKRMGGYLSEEALLIGFETRTSSPVRIPRNEGCEHPDLLGLFPCGEGAGYAGGIVSAAMDGSRCAESVAMKIRASGV